jgi:hypothetical protein
MSWTKATLLAPLLGYAKKLRFPWLFGITVTLLIVDLIIPDMIPFADEALLGLGALLLGSLKNRPKEAKNIESERGPDTLE